jgi:site-specific DNA-methyltransferase (adenine-specific)
MVINKTENMINITNEDNMQLMARYPDNYFDLAIVDPPYGIDINKSGRLGHYGGKGKKWDNDIPNHEYFDELKRVSKNQIIWGANYFNMPPTRCFLIWDKQQPETVSFASCEYAWTSFNKSAKTYYLRPQNADEQRIHPTQKPVTLYSWILKNYTEEGFKLLDTHIGSGSIALAVDNANKIDKMNLTLVGCELDKDYYNATMKRIKEQTNWQSLF